MPLSARRLGPYAAAVAVLVTISVLTLVGLGEGFKVLSLKTDGFRLRERDVSSTSTNVPWGSPHSEVSKLPPGGLRSNSNGAEYIPEAGSDVSNTLHDSNKLVSIGISKGLNIVSIVASLLNEASAIVNIVVSDTAMGEVSSIFSVAASLTAGSLLPTGGALTLSSISYKSTETSSPIPSSIRNLTVPINMTTQLNASTNASTAVTLMPQNFTNPSIPTFTLNITSPASQANLTKSPTATAIPSAPCPATTLCPGPVTSTCLITETWHSTHYESTATLYSFMNAITVTCTETIRICPQADSYDLGANTTKYSALPSTSHPCPDSGHICPDCPGGVFCPPQQTAPQSGPCGLGWACAHCTNNWFCSPSGKATPTDGSGGLYSFAPSMALTNPLANNASTQPAIFASGLSSLATIAGTISGPLFSLPISSPASLSSLGSGLGTATSQVNVVTTLPSSGLKDLGAGGGIVPPFIASMVPAVLTVPKDQTQNEGLNGVTIVPTRLPTDINIGVPKVVQVERTSLLSSIDGGDILSSVVSIATGALTPVEGIPLPTFAAIANSLPSGNPGELNGAGTIIVSTVVGVISGATDALSTDAGVFQGSGLSGLGRLKNAKLGGSQVGKLLPVKPADTLSESLSFSGKGRPSQIHKLATISHVDEFPAAVTLVISRTVIPLPVSETLQTSTSYLPTVTPELLNKHDDTLSSLPFPGNSLSPLASLLSQQVSESSPGISVDSQRRDTSFGVAGNQPVVSVTGTTTVPQLVDAFPETAPILSTVPSAVGVPAVDNQPTGRSLPEAANLPAVGSLTGLLQALGSDDIAVTNILRREKNMKKAERFVQDYLTFCEENPEESICRKE